MQDFKKIELEIKTTPEKMSIHNANPNNKKKFFSKKKLSFLVVLLIIILFFIFGILIPGQKVYSSANKTYQQAKKAFDAAKHQNIDLVSTELSKSKEDLVKTQNDLKSLSYLNYIPLISYYYNDTDHLLKAAAYGLDAATIIVDSVKPYADVLGLKGKGTFTQGSAEDRIRLAINTMGKVTPRIDDVAKSLELAKKEIDAVDPNHYPSFLGGEKIKKQLISLKSNVDSSVVFIDEARPLVKVLPSMLGESKERKYLVLFQNDKELRPTGGFITAYAVFRVDKGVIKVDSAGDIYSLDDSIPGKKKAPDAILKYLANVYTLNLRDSNLSPDFIESMKTFYSMYEKSPQKSKIDGIIVIDTQVLVSIIKILDDEVYAGGLKFTSKIDKRCDCPQVIYELENNISKPVNYQKAGRKDLIALLMYSIMEKSLKSSPKLYWGPLFQELIKEVNEKHIMFYLFDKDAQSGIESLNAAGRIKDFDGDYLHINETSFSGAKANLYVTRSVETDYKVKDGEITKNVTIKYKNPYPPSDCNLERGGLCLNAPYRNWFRIYAPKGSVLIDSQGSEVKIKSYEELGKTVFEGFLTVRPEGSAVFTISYKLPFKVQGTDLPVLIQKQPGIDKIEYKIKVNGKDVQKLDLITDKELKVNI